MLSKVIKYFLVSRNGKLEGLPKGVYIKDGKKVIVK